MDIKASIMSKLVYYEDDIKLSINESLSSYGYEEDIFSVEVDSYKVKEGNFYRVLISFNYDIEFDSYDVLFELFDYLDEGDEENYIFVYSPLNNELLSKINYIESSIREIITYIFTCKYNSMKYYDLLSEYSKNIDGKFKSDLNNKTKKSYLSENKENEFFYFDLMDYKSIQKENIKKMQYESLINDMPNSYEELLNKINNAGIVHQYHNDFISYLSDKEFKKINDVRAKAAHFRFISSSDISDFNDFYKNFLDVINTFWEKEKTPIFICKNKTGSYGKGLYSEKGFVLLEGSKILFEHKSSSGAKTLLKELLNEGVLDVVDNMYILNKDISISSPSMASDLVLGRSSNGWIEWKDDSDQTLDEMYRK